MPLTPQEFLNLQSFRFTLEPSGCVTLLKEHPSHSENFLSYLNHSDAVLEGIYFSWASLLIFPFLEIWSQSSLSAHFPATLNSCKCS